MWRARLCCVFGVLCHRDDHMSRFLPGFDIAMSLGDLCQRIAPVDDRFYFSRLDKFLEENQSQAIPAVLRGGIPQLLGGSEDPWLCVSDLSQVYRYPYISAEIADCPANPAFPQRQDLRNPANRLFSDRAEAVEKCGAPGCVVFLASYATVMTTCPVFCPVST